ncbi:MAG: helix-turn-helix transcriptional regulator [Proteobacteria bacterium]|nr:helix-turn-helix transcriptional regulator [Pseudomonadota bacterium]
MNFKNLMESYFSNSMSTKISEICAPLFEKFPINYFLYMRKYKDNSVLILMSHRDWAIHYLACGYLLLFQGPGIHSWVNSMPSAAIDVAASHFNIHNGITLEKVHENFIEIIELASPSLYSSPMEFLNQKNLLNEFIFYFKNEAQELIKKDKHLILPKVFFSKQKSLDKSYDDFCQSIRIKKFHAGENYFYTKKEFEVLYLIGEGQTVKQTAVDLSIGVRTVETHLKNAKIKTKSNSTVELIKKFRKILF